MRWTHMWAGAAAALAVLAGAAPAAAEPDPWIGYRGDGTCVAAGSRPPVEWNVETGRNVLWRTAMPNWGLSSPIVVADRVFITSEPDRDHDFPLLLCLDARRGTVLWQKELDPIAMMSAPRAERDTTRRAWHEFQALDRLLYRMAHAYRTAEDKAAAERLLAEKGLAAGSKGPGGIGMAETRKPFKLAKVFNRGGLYFDVWHWSGMSRIGYGYPTPVSDGESVYVATGLHGFSCFDLEGRARWQTFLGGQGTSNVGYGGNDFCKNARSPILYGDLLISDVGNLVRAIDTRTGRLVWSDRAFVPHATIVTPVVLTVGDQDVLLCFKMNAYRLPGGEKLSVEGWPNPGGTMLVKPDEPDVVFFTGGGEHGGWENKGKCDDPPPAAVRFRLDGDRLVGRVLWSGVDGELASNPSKKKAQCRHTGFVYHGGKLYHPGGAILDAATGTILAGTFDRRGRNRATPRTRHMLWIAGGHLYGLREYKPKSWGRQRYAKVCGVAEVYDLAGKQVAENVLPVPEPEREKRERIIETNGHAGWRFSFGCPFAVFGDRIYIRSNDYLLCIGRPAG